MSQPTRGCRIQVRVVSFTTEQDDMEWKSFWREIENQVHAQHMKQAQILRRTNTSKNY